MIAITADCGELGGLWRGREGLTEVGFADDAGDFRFLRGVELDSGSVSLEDLPLGVDSVFSAEIGRASCRERV